MNTRALIQPDFPILLTVPTSKNLQKYPIIKVKLMQNWSAATAALMLAGAVHADPVLIADARSDWQDGAAYLGTTADFGGGAGLPDTSGQGHWNYYFQNQATNNLTYLKFGKNASWPDAYGGEGNPSNNGWSNVSDTELWGGAPAAGELTWHPGGTDSNPAGPTVLRWTAGAAQAGSVNISGYVRLGSATFKIKIDGIDQFNSVTNGTTFNLMDMVVAAGSNVDFILYGGPGGASFIKAQVFQVATGSVPPLAPTGLSASGIHQQVNLSWTPATGADAYNIKRSETDGGPYTLIAEDHVGTTYEDLSLTNGITYYYVVSATNSGGESGDSTQASATPQPVPAPSGLVARGYNEEVNLTWSAVVGAGTYSVKRSLNDGGPFTTIATGVAATSYSDTGLTNGITYYYVVSAVNSNGEGPDSNQASGTPGLMLADVRPDYVVGTANGQTTQTVTANPQGLDDWSGTGVWNYYRMDYNNSGVLSAENYDGVLTLLPWGGGSYTTGISIVSANEIFDGMIPAEDELAWHGGGVPGDPFNNGKRNTVIRWTAGASAPATVDLTGRIRLPYTGFSTKTITIYVDDIEVWSYTADSGVDTSNSVSQDYSLSSIAIFPGSTIDYVLESGSGGRAALKAQITPGTMPPAAPADLIATALNQQVNLSWSPATGATSYNIKRSEADGGPYTTIASNVTETSYEDVALTNGVPYYYVVSATNSAGEGDDSAQASATPNGDPYAEWAGPSGYDLSGGRDDDDDGDGMTNFQEFAFGLDPTSGASVNPLTDISEFQSDGIFSYTRFAGSGLSYTYWISTDLEDWGVESVAPLIEEAGEIGDDGVQTVVVVLALPESDKVFLRVKAE